MRASNSENVVPQPGTAAVRTCAGTPVTSSPSKMVSVPKPTCSVSGTKTISPSVHVKDCTRTSRVCRSNGNRRRSRFVRNADVRPRRYSTVPSGAISSARLVTSGFAVLRPHDAPAARRRRREVARAPRPLQSACSIALVTSADSGVALGENRATTEPSLPTRNLAKFHWTSPGPSGAVGWLVKNA